MHWSLLQVINSCSMFWDLYLSIKRTYHFHIFRDMFSEKKYWFLGIIIMKSQTHCRLIYLPFSTFLKLRLLKTRWPLYGYLPLHFQFLAAFLNQIAAEICEQLSRHPGQENTALKLFSTFQLGKQLENATRVKR